MLNNSGRIINSIKIDDKKNNQRHDEKVNIVLKMIMIILMKILIFFELIFLIYYNDISF